MTENKFEAADSHQIRRGFNSDTTWEIKTNEFIICIENLHEPEYKENRDKIIGFAEDALEYALWEKDEIYDLEIKGRDIVIEDESEKNICMAIYFNSPYKFEYPSESNPIPNHLYNAIYFAKEGFFNIYKELEFLEGHKMSLHDITNGETFNFILGLGESFQEDDNYPPIFYEELMEGFRRL